MSVVILSGPTCSGKTSVEKALHRRGFAKVVSHTTRQPRAGEVDGQHYHFVTRRQFENLMICHAFVETVEFGGARYGKTSEAFVSALGQSPNIATVLEPIGARALRRHCVDQGIPVLRVWLDCAPDVQAQRFIQRIYSGDITAMVASQRLCEMLSIEQDWRDELLTFDEPQYGLVLSSTQRDSDRLASTISEFLNPLL